MIEDLKRTKNKFSDSYKLIDQLVDIGSDVGNLAVSLLEGLERQYCDMPAFLDYKNKLNVIIEIIRNIKNHSSLKEKYQVIYNQALVLLVENFESFLSDLTKLIVDKYPHLIDWPETKKKLAVDVTLLRYSTPTVGDLVLTSLKGEVNFQDLQSTRRFLKDYIKLDIILDEKNKRLLILGQALRNIVIHNNGRVDSGFLNQIREINRGQYKDKDKIKLTYQEYDAFKLAFLQFSDQIIGELIKVDKI